MTGSPCTRERAQPAERESIRLPCGCFNECLNLLKQIFTAETDKRIRSKHALGGTHASVAAANAILDRGYGRPAQLLDLSIDVVSRRLVELSDAELTILEQRLITINEQQNAQRH